ncbi:hypothetical protein AGLY_002670 [Aphis glycines]|uniref:Uncharacterized protein n=1 Tax=Aphis glycines TaxID=307491 RepID=A0A6G0U2A4_APHGL|nr:hypothetical protein AGLY_002670 [Aphis glycines]
MASRQSVSSILKPPKVRAPLKEIETVDQDADENTATFSKRKVSFSGMNKIKMYNTGATSLTVHQAPMFDEQISMLSDSSNAEKPKISGKFEKSDAQISIESTNCTNFEDNGRIIIEYESPNDNMEMTEALSGKILSDTIYTIDNNGTEHISYSSDYSENNMEFTEAIKVGQILTGDNSCDLSSTKMSETLVDESDEESVSQFNLLPSTPLPNVPIQNTLNISSSSSCMDFTCANTKSNLSCNTQSSNMELTCMTKSLKSIWSNDDYKSMSMELTQLPNRQTIEDNCELIYEYSEHSISMGSDTSCEIQEKSSCESDIVQTEKSEKNNSNYETIDCVLDNSNNGEENMIEELSLSMVSMDIDPTLEGNAFDISYVNVDNPLRVENEQKLSTISITAAVENSSNLKQSVLDNYSNIIDISNQNNESGLSILPTGSSFVVNMSPENNINKYVEEEKLLQQTLHDHTSVLDKNQYLENKSIIVENNLQKKYSRKTMVHTCPLIDQENSHENEDTSGTVKDNPQKYYSRKSIVPTTVFNDDISDDTSVVVEENQQEEYSRKSIAPTTVFNDDISDTSVVVEEDQQEKYSRKSIAPTTVFNDDISDTSVVVEENQQGDNDTLDKSVPLEENQQEKCSRKSIAPTTVFNDDISDDTSVVVEENQQEKYSRKSIAPTTVFNGDISDTSVALEENQQEDNNTLDTSVPLEENQQEKYSRKSIAPTTVFNGDISDTSVALEENQQEDNNTLDTSVPLEENQQEKYSRKSIAPTTVFNGDISDTSVALEENQQEDNNTLDTSVPLEENQQEKYSRKSIAPTTVFNGDLSDTSVALEENQEEDNGTLDTSAALEENLQENYSKKSIAPKTVFNDDISDTSVVLEENQQEKYSRKSIIPTTVFNDDTSDASVALDDNQQEMYSRKSIASISLFYQTQPLDTENLSDTSGIVKENNQNIYSRKSVAPIPVFNEDVLNKSEILEKTQQKNCSLQSIAMSVLNQNQSLGNEDVPNISVYNPTDLAEKCDVSEYNPTWSDEKENTSVYNSTRSAEKEELSLYNSTKLAEKEDTSAIIEECQLKRYSRKSIGPTSLAFTHNETLYDSMSNNSFTTDESNETKSDKAPDSEVSVSVNNQSNVQSDTPINNEENLIPKSKHQSELLSMISDDNFNSPFRKKPKKSINLTHLTKSTVEDQCNKNEMEITNDNFSENFENVSKMDISIEYEFKNDSIKYDSPEFLVVSDDGKTINTNIVHNHISETNKEENIVMELDELGTNITNEENNKNNSIKVTDNIRETNHILNSNYSPSCIEDKTTKSVGIKDISNILTDETHQNNEKSCSVNRKRSYSNRDCAPLSCSSFMSKPNIHHNMGEDFITDDFIEQSPIKNDLNKSLINEQLVIGNEPQESMIKNDSIKENLCNEVIKFLTRWNEQFIENKLVLDKCTNRQWVFNALDNNVILTITYSNISNNNSFLKVEDISFTSTTVVKNEIIQFGINWILSKYNPKVYKQICFTSRDVELLLKSLLEDVDYISKVMNNMSYVRDIYCVTFKDNKAQFVLHNMKYPLMVRIEILLSNIHKFSIKDLSVDCLFGNFNIKLLEEIMEDITKDYNVLQSLVEKLIKLY